MSNNSIKSVSRRNFLRNTSLGGTALLVGFYFPGAANVAKMVTGDDAETRGIEMCAWILINSAGKVTLVSHRAEMGQGVHQSIPQIIAEELEVDLKDVNVVFGEGNGKKFGSQITGGSSTIRGSYKNLLKLSASAREMLIQTAATKWAVDKSTCVAQSGHVIHQPSGKKFHYGELVAEASKLTPPKDVVLKKRSEYKLIGKPLRRNDTVLKTVGNAVFGLDKKLPGMLYAVVERNPRQRGVVKSFDDSAAMRVPGVKKVFKVQMEVFKTLRDGVAVVADSTWAAMEGRRALKVTWDDSGFEHVNTSDIFAQQETLLKTKDGLSAKKQGDPDGVLGTASKKLDVIYQTPYQAHAAMEPLNCVAHYQGDKIEIWGPIQAPDWVQTTIAGQFKMAPEKVTVNMTFLGGGFGRKAFTDYTHEAVLISKEINAPVQVVWTREDDMLQGPFRAGMSYRGQGAVKDGMISAIKFSMCGQNIDHWNGPDRSKANDSTTEGFLESYYESIKNISFNDVPFELPIINMWWRSVYASTNGFAYESFMDELANEAGADPMNFRRAHLKNERTQKLLDKIEEVSGWKNRKKNEGYGVAITECFASTVAQVVKVSRGADKKLKIDKVWAVMDCGWYVNPDIIQAQVEGSIVMALGAATTHEITFKDGIAEQKNFYAYQMPRIAEIPPIEIFVMDNDADAGGVGEPGLPPFAPALTNAIFDLTGKRIRKLPFKLNEV
jgi:isoquinoline 1-oxidoreductase subunit beta